MRRRDYKGHEETFGSDGCVYYLDFGYGSMGVCLCQLKKLYILNMGSLLCINHINKSVENSYHVFKNSDSVDS